MQRENSSPTPFNVEKPPLKLKYGKVVKFIYLGTCNTMHVDVIADKGKRRLKIE